MNNVNNLILTPVKGYEKYFSITKDGKVWSHRTNKLLKTQKMKTGYYGFSTRLGGRKSKAIILKIHRMVATTFIPNPLSLPQVNHIDGDKLNNIVENLEWCTAQRNSQHAVEMGLIKHSRGVYHTSSKLSTEDVEAIRANEKKLTIRELGLIYNVHHCTISRCIKNKRYK